MYCMVVCYEFPVCMANAYLYDKQYNGALALFCLG